MTPEEWKGVVGWEKEYQVSNRGRVRSMLQRNRYGDEWPKETPLILKPALHGRGYPRVCLRKGPRKRYVCVHVLVLESFTGARPAGLVAAHLDGDKQNSCSHNLIWTTYKDNSSHMEAHGTVCRGERNKRARLTNESVKRIRALATAGRSRMSLARQFGAGKSTISKVVTRKTWTHI